MLRWGLNVANRFSIRKQHWDSDQSRFFVGSLVDVCQYLGTCMASLDFLINNLTLISVDFADPSLS
jgi:hypothetical protein